MRDAIKTLSNVEYLVSNGLLATAKVHACWQVFLPGLFLPRFSIFSFHITAYRHALEFKTAFYFPYYLYPDFSWQCISHDHAQIQPDADPVWQSRA
ncbi:hypothetical protein [Undibacterium sp. YM2]|uniref:hypothetical protein n=1 Tax=Undibacterium sp. YM2 TaxID=2058625 RepID=UPI00138A2199|nr:hypothetical protein [Undibacterium sp. YM2]